LKPKLKLKFDATLDFQLDALAAITDLFEGMSYGEQGGEISLSSGALALTELGLANNLRLCRLET
jgi:hypothetical protein